ncbi:MAG: YibE/F family protein [Clostridiales bacterium]|jgi:uncharacterized membrane protein|nr:YibE/F family protein [Clostridiales bacterium]
MYDSSTITYEKGTVTAILDERTEPADGMPGWVLGVQTIEARFKAGPMKGRIIQLDNVLSTDHNIRVRKGQSVIIKADRPAEIEPYYTLYNYDRTPGLITVSVIFALFMAAVGRFKGLRSVLGLGVSLFFILGFLLPAIYRGHSPALMSIFTVAAITVFSLFLLNGFSRKTLIATVSSIAGGLFSVGFFFLISVLLHLSGYNVEGAEELIIVSRNTGLQLSQALFAGALISSAGAVMDIAMSVASSLYEVINAQSGMSARELFRSGMSIGQDMIGTMCQTLILAFIGSALTTFLVLISYGTRFDQFMSSDYVAIEVAHSVAGSLAVIVTVPVTAALCAVGFRRAPDAG